MLQPIKLYLRTLQTISIYVQDFPLFVAASFHMAFAIKSRAHARMLLHVKDILLGRIAIKDVAHTVLWLLNSINIKFAIKSRVTATKVRLFSLVHIKNAIKASMNEGLTKIFLRSKVNAKLPALKTSIDPNKYRISTFLKLGYWDEYTLGEMDGKTMEELSERALDD